jgi:hypothetical protein
VWIRDCGFEQGDASFYKQIKENEHQLGKAKGKQMNNSSG